jgi:hypothetical protein
VQAFCLQGLISDGQAKAIITEIAKNKIPNISINYEAK